MPYKRSNGKVLITIDFDIHVKISFPGSSLSYHGGRVGEDPGNEVVKFPHILKPLKKITIIKINIMVICVVVNFLPRVIFAFLLFLGEIKN